MACSSLSKTDCCCGCGGFSCCSVPVRLGVFLGLSGVFVCLFVVGGGVLLLLLLFVCVCVCVSVCVLSLIHISEPTRHA